MVALSFGHRYDSRYDQLLRTPPQTRGHVWQQLEAAVLRDFHQCDVFDHLDHADGADEVCKVFAALAEVSEVV